MKIKIYLLFLLYLLNCGCNSLLEDSGHDTEIKVQTELFSHILINNNFKLNLIQDTCNYIVYKGKSKMLEENTSFLTSDTLILNHTYDNIYKNHELPEAEVHIQDLKSITTNSPANILSANTLKGDHLLIKINPDSEIVELTCSMEYNSFVFHSQGSNLGGYEFSGHCKDADFTMNGVTNIFASNFKCENISIVQNTIGDAKIWASKQLDIIFYNSGNVYYKGTPQLNFNKIQINNQKNKGKAIPL